MPLCVTLSNDKIIFGKGTRLYVEVGKCIAFTFRLTIVVSVSLLNIRMLKTLIELLSRHSSVFATYIF